MSGFVVNFLLIVGAVILCVGAVGLGNWSWRALQSSRSRFQEVLGLFLCACAVAAGGTGVVIGIVGFFGMLIYVASAAGTPGF